MFVVFGAHTDPADLTEFFVGDFWAHTDSTDLTGFFEGGKSHRIVWWESGMIF